jgi:hypothetical protein
MSMILVGPPVTVSVDGAACKFFLGSRLTAVEYGNDTGTNGNVPGLYWFLQGVVWT